MRWIDVSEFKQERVFADVTLPVILCTAHLDTRTVAVLFINPTFVTIPRSASGGMGEKLKGVTYLSLDCLKFLVMPNNRSRPNLEGVDATFRYIQVLG
jgi:hypothetical protein